MAPMVISSVRSVHVFHDNFVKLLLATSSKSWVLTIKICEADVLQQIFFVVPHKMNGRKLLFVIISAKYIRSYGGH